MKRADHPAFPGLNCGGGVTIREWLAGLAMQGLLASDAEGDLTYQGAAYEAVHHADALLARLAGNNEEED